MFNTAIIIVLVLIVLVLIWYAIKSSSSSSTTTVVWPPTDYMKNLGGKCPDYWTYLGDNEGNNVCENTYNISTKNNSCKLSNSNLKTFPKLNSWPPTGAALTDRCSWINNCGPSDLNIDASWVGMDSACSQNS